MKVAEYIERCKNELGWDDEAEKEWDQIQTREKIFKKLTPFIERHINLLRVKRDVGMANSADEAEWKELQEAMPETLGDKKDD